MYKSNNFLAAEWSTNRLLRQLNTSANKLSLEEDEERLNKFCRLSEREGAANTASWLSLPKRRKVGTALGAEEEGLRWQEEEEARGDMGIGEVARPSSLAIRTLKPRGEELLLLTNCLCLRTVLVGEGATTMRDCRGAFSSMGGVRRLSSWGVGEERHLMGSWGAGGASSIQILLGRGLEAYPPHSPNTSSSLSAIEHLPVDSFWRLENRASLPVNADQLGRSSCQKPEYFCYNRGRTT